MQRLEDEVRQWQNFAATWKIPKDDACYVQTMQRFKHLYVELKDERRAAHEKHERMIADCLETAKPLLSLYHSHRTLLLAEQEHMPFDARVPDDYQTLENLAEVNMWNRPI